MRRKYSPLHDKWHRRVEGELRSVMKLHPRWFRFADKHDQDTCVNSFAKRIVGSIVADVAPGAKFMQLHRLSRISIDPRASLPRRCFLAVLERVPKGWKFFVGRSCSAKRVQ